MYVERREIIKKALLARHSSEAEASGHLALMPKGIRLLIIKDCMSLTFGFYNLLG